MKMYKIRIRTEYMLDIEVDAYNEEEAADKALGGYGRYDDQIMVDKDVISIIEVEND